MAADTSAAKQIDAPPLKPLNLKSRLAPTPRNAPKYSVTVKNAAGQEVVVACPRATRALVALMDVHAVNGGAACHWGGPAAFAEMLAALHSILFSTTGREWYDAYNFVNDAGHACEHHSPPGPGREARMLPIGLVDRIEVSVTL